MEVENDSIKVLDWRIPGTRVEILRSYAIRNFAAYRFVIGHPGGMKRKPPMTVSSHTCGVIEKQETSDLYSIAFSLMMKHNEYAHIMLLCHKDDFRRPEAKIFDLELSRKLLRGEKQ